VSFQELRHPLYVARLELWKHVLDPLLGDAIEILAVVIEDRIGGLHAVLEAFAKKGLNVRDASGFVVSPGKTAILILEVEDPDSAGRIAQEAGFQLYQEEVHHF